MASPPAIDLTRQDLHKIQDNTTRVISWIESSDFQNPEVKRQLLLTLSGLLIISPKPIEFFNERVGSILVNKGTWLVTLKTSPLKTVFNLDLIQAVHHLDKEGKPAFPGEQVSCEFLGYTVK